MAVPAYKSFKVVGAKSDIQQLYVTVDDHAWIKKQAKDNGVRMVNVVSALVDHANNSEEVFKRLIELLRKQDYVLAQGGVLPEKITAEIQTLIKTYKD